MSMDWIHLGISGFTKEDTIDESHRFTYDTGTSRVWFQVAQSQKCDKIPNESLARLLLCSFLTVKSWFACVFWHWIALVNQSQAAPGSNLMRKWSKFHGRNSSPKLESVFGPLQLYLFALAVTGLNCWTGQDVSRSWMVCKCRHGALDKKGSNSNLTMWGSTVPVFRP